ncbi:MAG: hypothetical protein M1114_05265 [Candidatus Dependentiae bacterium]|nr:hypothetical protein [Candidatus Dependentiae bacterium]
MRILYFFFTFVGTSVFCASLEQDLSLFQEQLKLLNESLPVGYVPLISDADLKLSDYEFYEHLKDIFKTELNWLLTGKIFGSGESFGAQDDEYLRTLACLLCLKWVLVGDYEKFTSVQPPVVKLSPEHFKELKKFTDDQLSTPQARDAMFVFLLINDFGKIEEFDNDVNKKLTAKSSDHDVLLGEFLTHYDVWHDLAKKYIPVFEHLAPEYRTTIINGQAADLNFGQFLQAENVPASLAKVATLSDSDLLFFIVHSIFDIAGAAGNAPNGLKGSISLVDPAYISMMHAKDALVKEHTNGPLAIYNSYLEKQAKRFDKYQLNKEGSADIDPEKWAILRLGLMMRAGNRKMVDTVAEKFNTLTDSEKENLIKELNKDGIHDSAIIIYYGPALFANAKKVIGDGKITGITFDGAMPKIMKLVAFMYQELRSSILISKGVITLNVRTTAQAILNRPDLLLVDLTTVGYNLEPKSPNEWQWSFTPDALKNFTEIEQKRSQETTQQKIEKQLKA